MVRRVRINVMFQCLCFILFMMMNLKRHGKITAAIQMIEKSELKRVKLMGF
jgi:hypothetical protein